MAEFFSIFVEAELDGPDNGWTVLEDVVQPIPIDWKYGIEGHTPRDRVAGVGTLSFALDNSEYNSQGLIGLYSPGHENVLPGFGLGTTVRLRLEYASVAAYFKWRGVIDSIKPIPGVERERRVYVTCVDWMDEAMNASLRGLAVQQNQRADQIFATIVANMVKQPAAIQSGFGMEQFQYALDQARDYATLVTTEFAKLASSEIGFVYLKGDAVQGGTLVFEDRRHRGTSTESVATFDSVNMLLADRQRGDVINRVLVKIHPKRLDEQGPGTVPTDIAGLTLWLDGETFQSEDGDLITKWTDISGAGNDFNASGGQRPTLKTGIVNGRTVLRFEGTSDRMNGPALDAIIAADAGTIFFVVKHAGGANEYIFSHANTTTPRAAVLIDTPATDITAVNHDGTIDEATKSGVDLTEWSIVMWNHDAGQVGISVNDARDSGRVQTASGNTTSMGANTVLAALYDGTTPSNWFEGDIAAVLAWNVALTETQRKEIESYLADRFDIELPYPLEGTGSIGTIIFQMNGTLEILRNTEIVVQCPYKDPDQSKARIGSLSQTDPEPTTDYLFNTLADGTGTDITDQLEITVSFGGNTAVATIQNNGPLDGFVTFFRLRGLGIYDDAEMILEAEDTVSQDDLGEHLLSYDMPYQSDPEVARDAAFYLLEQNSSQFTVPTRIGFIASASDFFMRQAIIREISDRITILDPVTAIAGDFFINGIHLNVDSEGLLHCEWVVVPADLSLYWTLDSLTQSQLDETTKLAYGLWNRFWILGVAAMGTDTRLNP